MSAFGENLKSRFAVLGGIVVLVLGVLLVRLWSMQIIGGADFAKAATANRVRTIFIPAPRGRILDAKGRILVTNRPALAVAVAPSSARDNTMLTRLASVVSVPMKDIDKRIRSTKLDALQPRIVALDVSQTAVDYISEHADLFPGVEVDVVPIRTYPMGRAAAHVLGYVGEISDVELGQPGMENYKPGDIVGKGGVEAQYEKVLQGERGQVTLEVDAKGRIHRELDRREPVAGRDIRLTVDIDAQRVAEQALTNATVEARRQGFPNATAGALVVMDVKTGGIVAMASAPSYDPSKFVSGISQKEWQSLTATESQYPLNNRAVMSQYPPASTFKVVTGLAALDAGFITPSTSYDCPYTWYFPGHENSKASWWMKHDWDPSGHGVIDFTQAIEQSADTYFYPLGYKFWQTPGEKLQAFSRGVGFGTKASVDLPGEAAGRVPDAAWKRSLNATIAPEYAQWVPGDTVNMAIGQGDLLVTPVQLVDLFAAVANGGRVLQPHVLDQVMASGGKNAALVARTIVRTKIPTSADNLAAMQRALLGVTEVGTAKGAFGGFGEAVAGKTGTAQVGSPNLKKGDPGWKDDYALFAGYAPARSPRYAIAVVIEQGGHGGSVAAPAAREVLAQLAGLPVVHVSATDSSR